MKECILRLSSIKTVPTVYILETLNKQLSTSSPVTSHLPKWDRVLTRYNILGSMNSDRFLRQQKKKKNCPTATMYGSWVKIFLNPNLNMCSLNLMFFPSFNFAFRLHQSHAFLNIYIKIRGPKHHLAYHSPGE